ncbi:hypothetical protein FACS189494_11140 [Spirochaetia bacterium]|nr:hypothetical protein FACS189494_11140 [Spirochaetia bacterium]
MNALVGYTGFVGANIAAKHSFDTLYNSKNITEAFGTKPDLLVYAGVPAEMFLANTNPAADMAVIENAAENIQKIAPKQLVLISTVAVLDNPIGADEDVVINAGNLKPYGYNRFRLEQMCCGIVENCHIVRLPALFGKGLKKNFIYDLINFLPVMLKQAKYEELAEREPIIIESYKSADNGFYKLSVANSEREKLKSAFRRAGFSALNFTDSRSVYQFYNLEYLWEHIEVVLKHNLPLLHIAVEPLSVSEVYRVVKGDEFVNEISDTPFNYDLRTKYSRVFGGKGGYIFKKEQVLSEIKAFVDVCSESVNL